MMKYKHYTAVPRWQYANVSQGSVAIYTRCGGILLTSLLQIYKRIYHRRDCENQLRSDKGLIIVMTGVSFLVHHIGLHLIGCSDPPTVSHTHTESCRSIYAYSCQSLSGVGLPLRAQWRPTSRPTPASPYFATHAHPVTAPFPLTRFWASSALISALLACYGYTALSLIVNRYFSYANVSQGVAGFY